MATFVARGPMEAFLLISEIEDRERKSHCTA